MNIWEDKIMSEMINTNTVTDVQKTVNESENSLFTNPNFISEINGEKQGMTEMDAVFAGVTLHSEPDKAEDVEENTDINAAEEDDIAATPRDAEHKESVDTIVETEKKEKEKRNPAKQFIELAETRTSNILDAIDRLGNLATKKNYVYTPEQVEKMFTTLEEELALVKKKFSENKKEAKTKRFSF